MDKTIKRLALLVIVAVIAGSWTAAGAATDQPPEYRVDLVHFSE